MATRPPERRARARRGRFLALLAALLLATPATADDHEAIRRLVESGRILPLEQILERARQRRPGQVLETELENEDGRLVYEIELLDRQGFVRELYFDAATGAFLKEEEDD